MLQSEMKDQSLSPNLTQEKVTGCTSIIHKLFLKISSSVISIVFGAVLCIVYLGSSEQVCEWSKAGRSLIQKKTKALQCLPPVPGTALIFTL